MPEIIKVFKEDVQEVSAGHLLSDLRAKYLVFELDNPVREVSLIRFYKDSDVQINVPDMIGLHVLGSM